MALKLLDNELGEKKGYIYKHKRFSTGYIEFSSSNIRLIQTFLSSFTTLESIKSTESMIRSIEKLVNFLIDESIDRFIEGTKKEEIKSILEKRPLQKLYVYLIITSTIRFLKRKGISKGDYKVVIGLSEDPKIKNWKKIFISVNFKDIEPECVNNLWDEFLEIHYKNINELKLIDEDILDDTFIIFRVGGGKNE